MKNICKKPIVVSIILLLIGVSYTSAISIDTQSTISNIQSEECRECQQVSKSDLIIVERLLDRVEVYSKLLLVLSKYNPELKELSEELSDEIAILKDDFADDPPFPFICPILYLIWGVFFLYHFRVHSVLFFLEESGLKGGLLYKMYEAYAQSITSISEYLAYLCFGVFECPFPWDDYESLKNIKG